MIKPLRLFILFVCVCFFCFKSFSQQLSVFDQLVYVNKAWNNQPGVDPTLKRKPAIVLTEQGLLQQHLREIEKLLRNRQPKNVSRQQMQSRNKLLDALHQYTKNGVFPINNLHEGRHPYFIDANNTYCAVGELMRVGGADELAKAIRQNQNYSYLHDIHHPDLLAWVGQSGFTLDELALIQPGYGGEWPATIVEMHYNNVGTDVGEYIEIHQSNGQMAGMGAFTTVYFYDHLGTLYKTVPISQMQAFNNNNLYSYQFPAGESFADSGKVVVNGQGFSGMQDLAVVYYNSSGIRLEDHNNPHSAPVVRNYATIEDESTPVGSSLTFCGLYASTWNATIMNSTIGSLHPCTIGALPVGLGSFTYVVENRLVRLKWQTVSEMNNAFFEIQRSADGINFSVLATVRGAGTTAIPQSYGYSDTDPKHLNHYRLRQVDLDGRESFSKILYVKVQQANPLAVLQNPAKHTLQLQVGESMVNRSEIIIYDLAGRIVKTSPVSSASMQVNIASLSAGKYFIRILHKDGQAFTQTFSKL
jgi:hypothetical protein